MPVRLVEGKLPYTGGDAITVDENKVISLNLRDENNLIIYDAQDDEIYVDLQLPDGIKPTDAFPVGVTTGRVLVADGWDKAGTIISAKTTSGDVIKLLYADDGTLWIDNGTGTFKQIYFKADVDLIIQTLTTYINAELAKKQNGVVSATAPESPAQGDLWYDTTSDSMKVYDGTNWNAVGTGGGGSDIVYATQAEYEALLPGALTDNKHYFIYEEEAGPTPPTPWQPGVNTIAYFPMDSDLLDHSGNSLSVTTYGNVSIGTVGGVSAGYFNLGELSGSVTTGKTVTALGWAYKTAEPNNDNASMFGFAMGNMGGPQGQIQYWTNAGDPAVSNKPGAAVFAWDTSGVTATSMNSNQWYHLAVTADWDTKEINFYVNGVLQYNYTSSGLSTAPNYLGMSRYNGIDRSWIGYLSEVIFESKCWTDTEISDYYDATKANYGIS